MTDEEQNAYIASIVRERERYLEVGDEDAVKHCDEELARVGPRRTPSRGAAQTRGS